MEYINMNTKYPIAESDEFFIINITKDKKFLDIIFEKLTRDICIPAIEDDLQSILASKTITLANMQELFTYLNDAEYSNTHYFDTVKDFILNENMSAIEAIVLTEQIKSENDYMMSAMCNYFLEMNDSEVDNV